MKKQISKKTHESEKSSAAVTTNYPTRGRIFEGTVTKKFPTRVVIEFERTLYVQKYQRFYKKKTRLHARIPSSLNISVGDYVRIRECRPLSKIINFIVIEKIRSAEAKQEKKE